MLVKIVICWWKWKCGCVCDVLCAFWNLLMFVLWFYVFWLFVFGCLANCLYMFIMYDTIGWIDNVATFHHRCDETTFVLFFSIFRLYVCLKVSEDTLLCMLYVPNFVTQSRYQKLDRRCQGRRKITWMNQCEYKLARETIRNQHHHRQQFVFAPFVSLMIFHSLKKRPKTTKNPIEYRNKWEKRRH